MCITLNEWVLQKPMVSTQCLIASLLQLFLSRIHWYMTESGWSLHHTAPLEVVLNKQRAKKIPPMKRTWRVRLVCVVPFSLLNPIGSLGDGYLSYSFKLHPNIYLKINLHPMKYRKYFCCIFPTKKVMVIKFWISLKYHYYFNMRDRQVEEERIFGVLEKILNIKDVLKACDFMLYYYRIFEDEVQIYLLYEVWLKSLIWDKRIYSYFYKKVEKSRQGKWNPHAFQKELTRTQHRIFLIHSFSALYLEWSSRKQTESLLHTVHFWIVLCGCLWLINSQLHVCWTRKAFYMNLTMKRQTLNVVQYPAAK